MRSLIAGPLTWRGGSPVNLASLARIAYDYRWCWYAGGDDVFRSIDEGRWELCGENPVRLLQEVSGEALARAARDPVLLGRAASLENAISDPMEELPAPCRSGRHSPRRKAGCRGRAAYVGGSASCICTKPSSLAATRPAGKFLPLLVSPSSGSPDEPAAIGRVLRHKRNRQLGRVPHDCMGDNAIVESRHDRGLGGHFSSESHDASGPTWRLVHAPVAGRPSDAGERHPSRSSSVRGRRSGG